MIHSRKQAVCVRLTASDVRRIKYLATRLGTRDSDVIRFAVKNMFAKLGPLVDHETRGKGLVPAFLESGPDVVRFFELDTRRLEAIINEGVDPSYRVARDDIALIALMGANSGYTSMRFGDDAAEAPADKAAELRGPTLRKYLYDKYVLRNGSSSDSNSNERLLSRLAIPENGGDHENR
jgi:hypothetical protein